MNIINYHLKEIFDSGELTTDPPTRKFRIVQQEGKRQVAREVDFYNLDAIISVGYRVNSIRATQFRQWATAILRDFAIKCYVLDRKRLENGMFLGEDYFERLVEGIREIRISERKFYQKITDIYATSVDYNRDAPTTKNFFARVQNKLHFAIHGNTAAELIKSRADCTNQNMGLTKWESAPGGFSVEIRTSSKRVVHQQWEDEMNNDRKMNARICVSSAVIIVLTGFGGLLYGGWPVDNARTIDNQNLMKSSPKVNSEPKLSATRPVEQPPPELPRKAATYKEIISSLMIRLKESIREREKALEIKSIEELPDSVNEFRLWYFPSHEEMRGLIFNRNDDLKPVILVYEGLKDEIYLETEKSNQVRTMLDRSNIENLQDVHSLEFTFSPGDSYLLFQIKTGRGVVSKVYLANIGSNVTKPIESGDLYRASELCRELSDVLDLKYDDCRRLP